MLEIVQQRLAIKLGILMTVAVAAGFTLAGALGTRTLIRSTDRLHREGAGGLAQSISASLRTTMLTGDGGHVRRLVGEIKSHIPTVGVRIFSEQGDEVFGALPPAPPADLVPRAVRDVLQSRNPVIAGDSLSLPILRDNRCVACHKTGPVLGVLTMRAAEVAVSPGRAVAANAVGDAELDVLLDVIRDGFYRIMLAPSAPRLDEYFAQLSLRVPGIREAAVFAPDKSVAYGNAAARNDPGARTRVLVAGPDCGGCHEDATLIDRSTLVVSFDRTRLAMRTTLPKLTETVLLQVMEAGLGRLATGFLDDVARTGAVRALTLHDAEGRTFHDAFRTPSVPADVDTVLRTGIARAVTDDGAAEYRFVEPLANETQCQACHGTSSAHRGAVEVVLNTSAERAERLSLQRSSLMYGVATIVLVMTLLALGLYYTVIRPVREIGAVADLVGAGRLDATVDVHTTDEMGRLGTRVNDMVRGLREKLALSKFVSRATLTEVESSAGGIARGGERRKVALVFSDIRGFTHYAESRQPEVVVEMLNRYLHVQAEVVLRHGGDIDKFVGDELMARFIGPDMAVHAARTAVEMVAAVAALNAERASPDDRVAVGIGVSVGEAVLGAMGAEHRMDFTAIGDVVNTAARLCGAAGPGEILVTDAVRAALDGVTDIGVEQLEPIHLKGKQDAVPVFRITAIHPA